MRRYLAFAPSLAAGLVGTLWLALRPFPYTPTLPWLTLTLVGLALGGTLLGGAWALTRLLPSFREVSRTLEHLVASLHLTRLEAVLLSVLTALGEEALFRGALLPTVGVWGQALLFGLLHPAGQRGWSYMLYALAAGALLGYATLYTGSLWPSMLAHAVVNLWGLWPRRSRPSLRGGHGGGHDC